MQDKTLPRSHEALARKLASLRSLPIKRLKKQWRLLYGSEPPHRVSRELLTRAVAYRIQEQVLGGLKPSTRRLLERLASDIFSDQVAMLVVETDLADTFNVTIGQLFELFPAQQKGFLLFEGRKRPVEAFDAEGFVALFAVAFVVSTCRTYMEQFGNTVCANLP